MTLSPSRVDPRRLFAALALSVVAAEVLVARGDALRRAPELLGAAVVADLVLFLPFLFWLLCVRTGRARPAGVLAVAGCGAVAAGMLLPHPPSWLGALRLAPAAAEIALLVWGLVAGRAFWSELRRLRGRSDDALENVHRALDAAPAMPAAAKAMAAELVALHYGLWVWRARTPDGPGRFGYHEGLQALVALALLATPAEAAVVHVLLRAWSETAAWAATALHGYSLIWAIAFYQAARLRPIALDDDTLTVRWSLLWTGRVPRAAVVSVEALKDRPEPAAGTLNLARFADRPVRVTLSEPIALHGPLGLRREGRVLLLAPDQPERLVAALTG